MTITVNGAPRDVPDGTTVGALVLAVTGATRGSAAVVAGEVVPRSTWDDVVLADGVDVEIVTAVQGG